MIYRIVRKILRLGKIKEDELPLMSARLLFRLWWRGRRSAAPKDLVPMIDYLLNSRSFSAVSPYWLYLARKHIEEIVGSGLNNFKQTVAQKYFLLVGWDRAHYYEKLFKGKSKETLIALYGNLKKQTFLNAEDSESYNVFTALLLEYVRTLPDAKRFLALEEPSIGNPATISFDGGQQVSSDLLNSVIDYDSIFHAIPESRIMTILEIGGGYGRNAYCNISLLPNLRRYIMVDIPPALFLAQSYIAQIFPNKKVFKFRPFATFAEIEREFNESELVFLFPEQIEMLPPKVVDLIIAIDCLHEMDKGQVVKYFHEFDRLGKCFYFKCWQKTRAMFFQRGEYPVHKNWKEILDRETLVPSEYFESMYEIE